MGDLQKRSVSLQTPSRDPEGGIWRPSLISRDSVRKGGHDIDFKSSVKVDAEQVLDDDGHVLRTGADLSIQIVLGQTGLQACLLSYHSAGIDETRLMAPRTLSLALNMRDTIILMPATSSLQSALWPSISLSLPGIKSVVLGNLSSSSVFCRRASSCPRHTCSTHQACRTPQSALCSGNLWTASAHVITAVIGAGVLSLAWCTAQVGWYAALVCARSCNGHAQLVAEHTAAAGLLGQLCSSCSLPSPSTVRFCSVTSTDTPTLSQ